MIPLIGPLEDGLLLVPALVNEKGPFVFAIDPDAHVSIIDEEVLAAVKPATGEGPKMLDENDTQQNRFYAEILSWQLGDLMVKGPKPAQIVGKKTFDTDGRRIHGVIGRDVIADSLVFAFHRDNGVVVLSTQKKAPALTGWSALSYSKLKSSLQNAEVVPLARRLVKANINGQTLAMHLDLGATTSQLRPRSWSKAKLTTADAQLALFDEAGMLRVVKQSGTADAVTVGGVTATNVVFVPYVDKRWPDQDIEGALGLGFFKDFNVVVNWDKDTFYVQPRKPMQLADVSARIARWQSKLLNQCPNRGCVKVTATDPLAGKPADQMPEKHPGIVVSVARDAEAKNFNLEALIAVRPAEGKGPLKWLVANLPGNADRAMTHLPADYVGAAFMLADVSSFPRACPGEGSCIDLLAAPREFTGAPAAKPAANNSEVPPTLLEGYRIAGDKLIVPDDDTKTAIHQSSIARTVGTFRVCLDTSGAVVDVEIVKPTNFAAYDARIITTIKDTWRYKPYMVDGVPKDVCTRVTFIYSQR